MGAHYGRGWFFVAIVTLVALPVNLRAEITLRQAQLYCVDIALLKGGVELRGTVLSRDDKELRMAVQRDWLASRHPEMAKKLADEAASQIEDAHKELVSRVTTWKEERSADTRLVSALQNELERLARPSPKVPASPSQFQIVTIPNDRVRRIFSPNDRSRKLAVVAWEQQLPNVETTSFGTLKTAVEKKVPDWEQAVVNLAERLPTGEMQSPDEWAARQAVFEYEYRLRLDFHGTGSYLVRTGEGAERPNLAEILTQTTAEALKGGLGSDEVKGLGLDLDPSLKSNPSTTSSDWQTSAIEQAKALDARGFLVTRVPSITGTGTATVASHFFARMNDGTYRIIWSNESATDPASLKREDIERVEQDPQVQEITKVAKALSFDAHATTAVRFGAAIQASMRASQSRFFDFRQRYNNTLDTPPLPLPVTTGAQQVVH